MNTIYHNYYSIISFKLQRMNDSLRFESVGLTGKRFFYVSKGLILAVT